VVAVEDEDRDQDVVAVAADAVVVEAVMEAVGEDDAWIYNNNWNSC